MFNVYSHTMTTSNGANDNQIRCKDAMQDKKEMEEQELVSFLMIRGAKCR